MLNHAAWKTSKKMKTSSADSTVEVPDVDFSQMDSNAMANYYSGW